MASPGPIDLAAALKMYGKAQKEEERSSAKSAESRDMVEAKVLAELRRREEQQKKPGPEQKEKPGPLSQETDDDLRAVLAMINGMRA